MKRILLIEEDRDQRRRWSRWLVEQGYQVEPCNDGLEAVRAVLQRRPDLIVCSACLHDPDQSLKLQEIRALDRTIRVVLHVDGSLSDNDMRYGLADACVPQSARAELLVQTVAQLLRSDNGTG